MDKQKLKKQLLQKIIFCDDEEVLRKLNKILQDSSVAEDPTEAYKIENNPDFQVPDLFYSTLKKDYEDFLNGKLTAKSWQEVRSTLEEKNGI